MKSHSAVKGLKGVPSLSAGIAGSDFALRLREYQTKLSKITDPELRKELEVVLPGLIEGYESFYFSRVPEGASLGVIHGDPNQTQILFDRGTKKLRALIDWEAAFEGPRGYDIVYALGRLGCDVPVKQIRSDMSLTRKDLGRAVL